MSSGAGSPTPVGSQHDDPVARRLGRGRAAGSVLDVALAALSLWRAGLPGVVVVAIDGHGASGKSTLAESLRTASGGCVVHTDDFFLPSGPVRETERSLGSFYDLNRLRVEALEPLRAGQEAVFHPFDWSSGTVSGTTTHVAPHDLVLLEGVCSGAPELADLVDQAMYVETPEPERLRRLRGSVAPEDWDNEWLQAEKAYFAGARPPSSFDLVVPGTGAVPPAPRVAHAPAGHRRVGNLEQDAHRRR